MLSDGNWHKIEELQQNFDDKTFKCDALVSFMGDFNLTVFDNSRLKIKVKPGFRDFLLRTE